MEGAQIFHGQDVVGLHQLGKQLRIGAHVLQGLIPGPGEAFTHLQMILQIGFEFRRLLGQILRQLAELGDIPLLGAEGQVRHQPRGVEEPDGPLGEPLRRSVGEHRGQLDDQIRAGLQGPLGPCKLVRAGGLPSLDEVA